MISTPFNYGTYQICIIFEGFNTVQPAQVVFIFRFVNFVQIGFVDRTGARLEEILDLNIGICEVLRGLKGYLEVIGVWVQSNCAKVGKFESLRRWLR